MNAAADCASRVDVPPVDVTARLGTGEHLVALRVSNPVARSYADVRLHCVEP